MHALKIEIEGDISRLVRAYHRLGKKEEEVSDIEKESEKESIKKLKEKAVRYTGHFLVVSNALFPFFKLPFMNYEEATIDLEDMGNLGRLISDSEVHFDHKERSLLHILYRPKGFWVGWIY